MLEKMWRNRNPLALLVGMQTGAATLENSVEIPQKTKSRTSPRPNNCIEREACLQNIVGLLFCTAGENVNWCSHSGKQYGGSLKN